MAEVGPIRVFLRDGQWLVDYGSYAHGYHATRRDAVDTATKAARNEQRALVVEPTTTPALPSAVGDEK